MINSQFSFYACMLVECVLLLCMEVVMPMQALN
jgi:hypothetical protein